MKRDWLGIALLALCAYLVSCLRSNQREMMTSVSTTTTQIAKAFTDSISEVTTKQTELTGLLILGRDSPSPSESLPTNWPESETSKQPEIDLSAMPESAMASWELEQDLALTEMPWQSSTQPDDLES